MALAREALERMVREAFPEAEIKLIDLAGDNDHWAIEIASPSFAGKNRIQQHKMVYAALQGKMGGELHALQLKTKVLTA